MWDLALPPGIKPPMGVWPLDPQGSPYFSFIFFFKNFYLCSWLFFDCAESSLVHRLSLVVVSEGRQLSSRGLNGCSSQTPEHGLRFSSSACGVFPDQELNMCLLHFAGSFFTTELPAKPSFIFLTKYFFFYIGSHVFNYQRVSFLIFKIFSLA